MRRAVGYLLMSGVAFSLMAAQVKLAADLPLSQRLFFRNIVALFIAYSVAKKTNKPLFGKRENQKYLMGRALFGSTGMLLYFYALSHTYLADASMLHKTSPFFITLFAGIWLKEQIRSSHVVFLVLVFSASMLIIKPRFDMSVVPALAAFGSALFSGIAHVTVRYLGSREAPATIVFYFSLVSTIIFTPLMLVQYQAPTNVQWVYLVGMGACAAVGQFFLTLAYKKGEASELALYSYIDIIMAVVFGILIWGEIPDRLSVVGGVLLIGSAVFAYFYRSGQRKSEAQKLDAKV